MKQTYFWQTQQFALWVLTVIVAVFGFQARGYVRRLETVEDVQKVNLPKLLIAESDVETLKIGQDKILQELRDINKWLREARTAQ